MMQAWQNFLNHYTPVSAENINSLSDLSYLGLLKISGLDAKKFLQGQLTCNMDEVTETQSRIGAHCNPKGRIISLFRIFYFQDSYYLQMPRESIALAINALKKYAVFFKVTLSDVSDEFISIGYINKTQKQLDQLALSLPSQPNDMVQTDNLLIINIPGKSPRYVIIGHIEAISTFWKKAMIDTEYAHPSTWQHEDIEAEHVHIYPETSEKFLPHEINLHLNQGISFNKGCYTGQEIIARMHYRGKLKNQLQSTTIQCAHPPQRGGDIAESSNCIVDFCKTGQDRYECLIITNIDNSNS